MHLSVIIPAYNEEKRLANTLRAVGEYLQKQDYDFEVIVVSDGSRDGTVRVAQAAAEEFHGFRVIANTENHGKGYVVRQGMTEAKGAYRIFMDADNATTLDHVERMWPKFAEGYGIVIGSRDLKDSVLAVPQPWIRRRLGDVFNMIVQLFSGMWGFWDTQCGFKGFTAKAAEDIFPAAIIDRWAFDVELLVIAKRRRHRIAEVPVTWINDPDSKVRLKGMIRMLFEVVQIRWNLLRGLYDASKTQQSPQNP